MVAGDPGREDRLRGILETNPDRASRTYSRRKGRRGAFLVLGLGCFQSDVRPL
jgi:hypothetical protein